MITRTRWVIILVLVVLAAGAYLAWPGANSDVISPAGARVERVSGATTRDSLRRTIDAAEAKLAAHPESSDTAVELADALIRLQRVNNDAGAVITAEQKLRETLQHAPGDYNVQRMLGAVLLSQHRFRDAIVEAERARAADPRDAWNYGVLGDARLELGDYDGAFAAFESMGRLRPGPAAYARIAYALELKGQLQDALVEMKRAADATGANDAEGQAWHYAQMGNLLLQLGRVEDARLEFERANYTFPNHPYAMTGIARVKIAGGDLAGALAIYQRLLQAAPTPEIAAVIGDLQARLGDAVAAERNYVEAEKLERDGWAKEEPQPQALARFLAERDRNTPEAVRLVEQALGVRRDIFTMDAAAWAYFRAGRLDDARKASDAAMRTGTSDVRILYHAAAIRAAQGQAAEASALVARLPAIETDLLAWPAAQRLRRQLSGQ